MKVSVPDSGLVSDFPEGLYEKIDRAVGLWEDGFPERRNRMKRINIEVSCDCGCEEMLNKILQVVKATKAEVFRQSTAAEAAQVAEVKNILEPAVSRLEGEAEPETVPTPPPA